MSEFVKKNNDWFRNNSDGTQTKVQFKDGYFYWTQSDGKKVRSKKKYNIIKSNPRDTILNLKHRLKVKEADNRTAETSAFHKPLNFLSPSLYVGAAFDYFQGETPFWEGIYNGNSGIIPDNIAREYPRLTTLSNFMFDLAAPTAVNKTINYVQQPVNYPAGAETVRVWSPNRLSTKVFKEFPKGYDDVVSKNSVPESAPLKYEFESLEGNPVYSQLKMVVPKKLDPKKFGRMLQRAANQHFFPNLMEGEVAVDLVNPNPNNPVAVTDIDVGNIGYPRFTFGLGKYKILDSSGLMPISDYLSLYYKKGGKLNGDN